MPTNIYKCLQHAGCAILRHIFIFLIHSLSKRIKVQLKTKVDYVAIKTLFKNADALFMKITAIVQQIMSIYGKIFQLMMQAGNWVNILNK